MPAAPRLALIPGEPAGIGPELCVRIAQTRRDAALVAYGDGDTLLAAAHSLGLPLRLREATAHAGPGELALVEHRNAARVPFGHADPANAGVVIGALTAAAHDAMAGAIEVASSPVHFM